MIIDITPSLVSNTKVIISGIDVFSSGAGEDRKFIKPFYSIDGVPLTEHNRVFSSSLNFNSINVNKWNSRTGVYFKKQNTKHTFNLSWSFVPGKRENTVDLNEGRNFIKAIAIDQLKHTFSMRKMNTNGLTPYTVETYNVLVTEYNETLIRRDMVGNEYYWDCSITLQEV